MAGKLLLRTDSFWLIRTPEPSSLVTSTPSFKQSVVQIIQRLRYQHPRFSTEFERIKFASGSQSLSKDRQETALALLVRLEGYAPAAQNQDDLYRIVRQITLCLTQVRTGLDKASQTVDRIVFVLSSQRKATSHRAPINVRYSLALVPERLE